MPIKYVLSVNEAYMMHNYWWKVGMHPGASVTRLFLKVFQRLFFLSLRGNAVCYCPHYTFNVTPLYVDMLT
jgi:hypothetical protein